ncbi:MAG: SUF system NifU family Fe-S cluster assembly protein [Steroidobacteraceae bacterium]|nr:SUF system NifU family Fe-S cluster assembly protein [Steroidobacteraceae bacterium]
MDLKDLYRDVILDHNKRPRNFGTLPPPAHEARGHNPLCGDQLTVYVELDGDVIRDLRFEGKGCAISVASASLMSEAVKGRSRADANALYEQVHDLLTRQDAPSPPSLGKLAALQGVREFPARVKCASLCWHTLNAALEGGVAPVSTE